MSGLSSSWRRLPSATYRLQFNANFGFQQALEIVDYLHELGISDCYASPLFQARPESLHGYDVCDFSRLNPALGQQHGFDCLTGRLRELGMGLLLDIVPNHMGAHLANPWWHDVLENGEASPFATWFDIDWRAPGLEGKVLLPILEDHYAKVLEQGKLSLRFEFGGFVIAYYDAHFPLSRHSSAEILTQLISSCQKRSRPDALIRELRLLANALSHPGSSSPNPSPDFWKLKQYFAASVDQNRELREDLSCLMEQLNGRVGGPGSFDQLHGILQRQHYRFAYWRAAPERINYRRFFDISELISLRMENPEVFEATHGLILRLAREGKVTGLRIDHPDGLWNPKQYLERIQAAVRASGAPLYVVVEKILTDEELLPFDWPVAGTTGYDFLNQVNGLFVNTNNSSEFDAVYHQFTGNQVDFAELIYASKKRILLSSFVSELDALARRLETLATASRAGQDFTYGQMRLALTEVLAAFPVYRTYIDEQTHQLTTTERAHILQATHLAKIRSSMDPEILAFVERMLLLEPIPDFGRGQEEGRREFIMKFQQLSGPLMAKGLEDTTFYNYNRLTSLNDVGGNPGRFGTSVQAFHGYNKSKCDHWPHSLLATATHDTKRGEDTRARINVLSEMPQEWKEALVLWRRTNERHKTNVDGRLAPHANDEYLLYQTLIGAWVPEPERPAGLQQLRERMVAYILKAIRESKANTSWNNPNQPYEEAIKVFVEKALTDGPDNSFLRPFKSFQRRVAFFGQFNSLSQTLLKMTAPGVPDFYQGTELWDFNLVDPDNRRPVNYGQRKELLASLKMRFGRDQTSMLRPAADLLQQPASGESKLFLIWRTLQFRREHLPVFERGSYLGLRACGSKENHVCAFARELDDELIVVVVPRLVLGLTEGQQRLPLGPEVWGDTCLQIPGSKPHQRFRNILTGQEHFTPEEKTDFAVAEILSCFPVALLERVG